MIHLLGLDALSWDVTLSVLVKLGLGVILGAIIGLERNLHGRPAGLRTHMMMVLGVILFCEVSKSFGGEPSRIAAQIITGVGFLGAGTIIRLGHEIRGLTTAASIWATAGIGMAVSVGGSFLFIAVFATLLALVTLTVLDTLERRYISERAHYCLDIKLETLDALKAITEELERNEGLVQSISLTSKSVPLRVMIEYKSQTPPPLPVLLSIPGVLGVDVS